MKRELGLALIVGGATIFLIGFAVVEDYIGIFVMPIGLALLFAGFIIRKREPRPSPWPPPAPMPPTVGEQILEQKGLGPTPQRIARAKARRAVNVIILIIAAFLIFSNLVAGSSPQLVLVPVLIVVISLSRLISERIVSRRQGK